ncbi:MAG: hypothetical protein NXI16_16855 [Alphaproteobacteria bacterium]|nr:hypothetical protein [Alphaproteobacteria bacterium]
MAKIVGTQIGKPVDHLMSQDQLDKEVRRKLTQFMEDLQIATFKANQEVFSRALPMLRVDDFVRFSRKVAEARADYISAALEETNRVGPPDPMKIKHIQALRVTYEELAAAYEATERLIERGYSKIG